MDLNEIQVFVRVVQAGSFTAAAAALGMPKSTVSRKVAALEDRLNARLLHRTTRKLSLTDEGRAYYEHCARVVDELEDAERALSSLQGTPRGVLRVTAPVNVTFLGPIVSDYLKRYPEVRLELFCTGRAVDLVEERFDSGIRAGTLTDSSLIIRSLGSSRWFLAATPAYLERRGRPKTPDDLKQHDCLLFGTGIGTGGVRLAKGEKSIHVPLAARLMITDMDILQEVAMAGHGIALLPAFRCVDDLRARRFEVVLPDWTAPSTPIQVVYPSTRHLSPKVKTFVEHLQARMTPPPWEQGPLP